MGEEGAMSPRTLPTSSVLLTIIIYSAIIWLGYTPSRTMQNEMMKSYIVLYNVSFWIYVVSVSDADRITITFVIAKYKPIRIPKVWFAQHTYLCIAVHIIHFSIISGHKIHYLLNFSSDFLHLHLGIYMKFTCLLAFKNHDATPRQKRSKE